MRLATRTTVALILGSLLLVSAAGVSSSTDGAATAAVARPAVAVAHTVPTALQAASGPASRPQAVAAAAPAFDSALLTKYCVACHNERGKARAGGLALDQVDPAKLPEQPALWEKVVAKLRSREMPPIGRPRPEAAEYASAITSLEIALDRAAAQAPNAGRIAVHRLNRTQYANAIRDVLGLEVDVQTLLRPDETGYGFDNIADVLTISPGLMEEYKLAAWKVSRLAVGDPTMRPSVATYQVSRFLDQAYRVDEELPFGTRGGTVIKHTFPLDGEYVLRISLQRAYAQNVIKGLREREQIDVRMNGEPIKLFAIGGECVNSTEPRCVAFQPKLNVASGVRILPAEYDLYADKDLVVRFPVKAGPAIITAAFLERDSSATEGGGAARKPLTQWQTDTGEGLMAMDNVSIEGPFDANVPTETESRRRIFTCYPTAPSQEADCARRIISTLARRAYRRPPTDHEVAALLAFYERGRSKSGFDLGIQTVIEALLMTPNFLLRVSQDPPNVRPGTNYRLSGYELASRLSFFLWSSVPDDDLLQVAGSGRLQDPKVLAQQVQRMIADPRSKALIKGFFSSWLSLRDLANVVPDPAAYPDFDENLRSAFQQETELFLDSQLHEDRPITDLLTANYTFLNERLAAFYGVPNVYGARFRRVTMTDPNRMGLLGHGSILTVTSYSTRTSPVVRGKWLLTNILGSPPPAPPPNVPALVEAGEGGAPPSTVRERMAKHRSNAVCASCHNRIDPMGFALENFSAIGRYRTSEFTLPIDPSGAFPDGSQFKTPAEFRKLLAAQNQQFISTVTMKLLTYALGRGVEYYDMPAVRKIMREAAAEQNRWSALVLGIINSMPFQMNRSSSSAAVPTEAVRGQ
jgi:hypothetical protein